MPKGTIDISKKCKPSKPTFRRDRGGRIYWFNNGDQEVWVVFEDGHPFHDDKDPCKGKKKCRIHVPALRYSKGKKVKPQKTKTDECLPFTYRVEGTHCNYIKPASGPAQVIIRYGQN